MLRNRIAVLFTLLIGLAAITAQEKRVEFGISTGYGYNIPLLKDNRLNPTNPAISDNNLSGFHVGPAIRVNINENFALQTGVNYGMYSGVSIDAAQRKLKKIEGTWKQVRNQYSDVGVPLRVVYRAELADDFYFLVFAGPNFDYSLNKTSVHENYTNHKLLSESSGSNLYENSDNFKRFDIQAGAGIGVEWMNLSIRGGFDWGFFNHSTIKDLSLRNNDLKVSLSYFF